MKKLAILLTLILISAILPASPAYGAELPLRVVVNGEKISFPDAQPFIDANGRTQTPARFIGEALGAKVSWDGTEKKATFTLDNKTLVLYIGEKEYQLNGRKLQMDTAALLKEDRTFVPARYVAEAFGAEVKWEASIRTVYITTGGVPVPIPQPQGGTVEYYDGIAFNAIKDIDQYGRISVEKSKEFMLKLTEQLTFVKENGKYYIKCDYPELPESYEWSLVIRVYNKDGTHEEYLQLTRRLVSQIPREGSFTKEVEVVTNINNLRSINMAISINPDNRNNNVGILDILYYRDGTNKRAEFVPKSAAVPSEEYTDTFDFGRMFQW